MVVSATPLPSYISFFSSSIFFNQTPTKKFLSFSKPLKSNPISQSTFSLICFKLATLPVLSFDGSKIGETTLNLKYAPPDAARTIVHRDITTDLQNKRRGTASTLTHTEVRDGGKKLYPQKKTSRSRRGSNRTPLRPGGGVVFGPNPRYWSIKINKKEKRLAISLMLDSAAENGIVVEEISDKFEKLKTKEFIGLLNWWGIDPKEKSMFLITEVSDNVRLSRGNIGTLKMLTPRTLDLFDILNSDKLFFTQAVVDYLNEAYIYDLDGESEGEDGESEDDDEQEDEC